VTTDLVPAGSVGGCRGRSVGLSGTGATSNLRVEQTGTDALGGAGCAHDRGTFRCLDVVLEAHPELVGEAESEARRLLSAITVDDVAADVSSTLRVIRVEELAARAGRVRGPGYVHETDAAWELMQEAVEPFLADMRRRASLGMSGPAAVLATGIVAACIWSTRPTKAPCWRAPALASPASWRTPSSARPSASGSASTPRRLGGTGPGGTSSSERPVSWFLGRRPGTMEW